MDGLSNLARRAWRRLAPDPEVDMYKKTTSSRLRAAAFAAVLLLSLAGCGGDGGEGAGGQGGGHACSPSPARVNDSRRGVRPMRARRAKPARNHAPITANTTWPSALS